MKMFITLSLISIFVFLLFYMTQKQYESYWKRRSVFFEKPLPFLGNIIEVILFRKSLASVIKDLYFKIDQPFFGIWTFDEPQLVIKDPELIKQILVKDFVYFQDRNITCSEEVDDFSSNMIFCARNSKWRVMRAEATPIFSITQMKNAFPQIQNVAKEMVEHLNSLNGTVDVKKLCIKYSVEAICSTFFGVDLHSFRHVDTEPRFNLSLNFLNQIPFILYICKNSVVEAFKIKMVSSSIANNMKNFLKNVLEETKNNLRRNKLIDTLMKSRSKRVSKHVEIMSICAEFLFAAYQSTSTIIALVLYELSLNKSIQNKLREEILANLDIDGDIPYSTMNNMKYLHKVVSEILRKYPVIPTIGRRCVKDYKIPNSAVIIEKGVNILIPLNALQHDPKYYPLPEMFDPDRFSEENSIERHPYSYLPFGEGPRKCMGLKLASIKIKLAVAHVIKNFEIEICGKSKELVNSNLSNVFILENDRLYIMFKLI